MKCAHCSRTVPAGDVEDLTDVLAQPDRLEPQPDDADGNPVPPELVPVPPVSVLVCHACRQAADATSRGPLE